MKHHLGLELGNAPFTMKRLPSVHVLHKKLEPVPHPSSVQAFEYVCCCCWCLHAAPFSQEPACKTCNLCQKHCSCNWQRTMHRTLLRQNTMQNVLCASCFRHYILTILEETCFVFFSGRSFFVTNLFLFLFCFKGEVDWSECNTWSGIFLGY